MTTTAMVDSASPGADAANGREAGAQGESRDDLRAWNDLSGDEQTALRIEYGRYLDSLPPTCSLDEKERRFAGWLSERGIRFSSRR
jgi:hypothetical protein